MNKGTIFLMDENESSLLPMEETEYINEDVLQTLLEKYPELLPGDQINPDNPRRWLLIGREMGVPGEYDEGDRWSLDHLFVDQDGIPTFVECKRSSDTRIRREVIAQMLDYAANGTKYWNINRFRQSAAEHATKEGMDLNFKICTLLQIKPEDEESIEKFWITIETNLKAGRIRLLFVTDKAPSELKRLVEFLNEKMMDIDVLLVEIRQYIGNERKTIVPRVLGQTEAIRQNKQSVKKSKISRSEFLDHCTDEAVSFFQNLFETVQSFGFSIYWGTVGFSIRATYGSQVYSIAYGYPPNKFSLYIDFPGLPPDKEAEIRSNIELYGIFGGTGKKTYNAYIDSTSIQPLYEAAQFMFQMAKEYT